MAPHKTITVNGRRYDAVTGLPVEAGEAPSVPPKTSATPPVAPRKAPSVARPARPAGTPRPDFVKTAKPATKKAATPAKATSASNAKKAPITPRSSTKAENVHSAQQRSQTLNRRAVKKPATPQRPITRRPTVGRQMDVAPHAQVSRFAKNPASAVTPKKPVVTKTTVDAPARVHPIAKRAVNRAKAPVATKPASAKQVKEQAIAKALAAPKPTAKPSKKAQKNGTSHLRRWLIIGGSVIVLVAILVSLYKLVPSISVSIASAQAGIEATYPEFTPDGFSLSQPVTFRDGEVDLKFTSNSNENYYTITQTRSSWDSSAVLDNVVTPAAGADYVTTRERGLTIYTYESAAIWVNGGILYKIDSKAPLSGDQIRKIATSL